jgi:hypothetical protein
MSEQDEAHKFWLERKERATKRLREYMIAFDVAAIFAKSKEEKKFYNGAKSAISEAITFIEYGEI